MDKIGQSLTHRRILAMALPIVISNATIPILGIVDTGVVGQLGAAAPIGAVGLGAIVLTAFYWVFGFLRMGTVGLTSQALGAHDQDEVIALFWRAFYLALIFAAGIIILQIPLMAFALWLSPASAEVEGMAREYMQIRIFSSPAAIGIYAITGWLIAHERTAAVLVIQLGMNLLNIGLDFVFVMGFNWGVPGVAWATFIAEWSGLAVGLWLCRGAWTHGAYAAWGRIWDRARMIRMAQVNGDILVRSVLLQIAFVSFLFIGSDFGDVTLAANQILLQFLYVTSYAMDGFAFAAEALVGQALGARARNALRRSAIMTSIWGVGTCFGLSFMFWIFGNQIVAILAKSTAVQMDAERFLIWMVLAPMLGAASWMFDGIFIGATRTKDMREMMILSFIGYLLAVLTLVPIWGNHGLWAALILFFVLRGITLAWKYPGLEADSEKGG